jgi:hypothetical protein
MKLKVNNDLLKIFEFLTLYLIQEKPWSLMLMAFFEFLVNGNKNVIKTLVKCLSAVKLNPGRVRLMNVLNFLYHSVNLCYTT